LISVRPFMVLLSRLEHDPAAVMVSSKRLPLISLEGAQPDQIFVKGQRGPVPHKSIDAVAQERYVRGISANRPGTALGPVQVNKAIIIKAGVKGDSQQPALGEEVDR